MIINILILHSFWKIFFKGYQNRSVTPDQDMRLNSTIFGILLIISGANSAFASGCFGCACGNHKDVDNEVSDPAGTLEQVHGPTTSLEQSSESTILTIPVCSVSLHEPRKSALKRHYLENQAGFIEKAIRHISRSPEIEPFYEVEEPSLSPKKPSLNTSQVFRDNRVNICIPAVPQGPDAFVPIIPIEPYDYQVDSGTVLNEILAGSELPADILELIQINYPGLGNVALSIKDLAGLVLFATYYHHPIEFFQTSNLFDFFSSFSMAFPDCLELIQLVNLESYRLTRMAALNGLIQVAFKSSLYYTIEAFFLTFNGSSSTENFIKESIKSGDIRIFHRLNSQKNSVSVKNILVWSIKYGNNQVFQLFSRFNKNILAIKEHFKVPILVYVAEHQFHFPGIVEMMLRSESLNFDEALSVSISKGNYKLFKDLIKYNNSYFGRLFNRNLLHALRSIYWGHGGQVIELRDESLLKEIYKIVVMLDSDDLTVLEVFRRALSDLTTIDYIDELLQLSIFSKTRFYFKMILQSSHQFKFCYQVGTIENEIVCLWHSVSGSKFYSDIMADLVKSPSFDLSHALANPDFPSSLWPELLERFKDYKYVRNLDYKQLVHMYGFNSDLFNAMEIVDLNIHKQRTWSILELAILSFNHVAVDHIVPSFDSFNVAFAIDLAKQLKELLNSKDYTRTHLMKNMQIKQNINRENRLKMPNFFTDEIVEQLTVKSYVLSLESSITAILKRLEKQQYNK